MVSLSIFVTSCLGLIIARDSLSDNSRNLWVGFGTHGLDYLVSEFFIVIRRREIDSFSPRTFLTFYSLISVTIGLDSISLSF